MTTFVYSSIVETDGVDDGIRMKTTDGGELRLDLLESSFGVEVFEDWSVEMCQRRSGRCEARERRT